MFCPRPLPALALLVLLAALCGFARPSGAEPLDREAMAAYVIPPMSLGEPVNDKGVWTLLNSGGAQAGYVFETETLAPLPGFSGAPINLFVMLDLEGRFLDVRLISQNEPIFVSGLGEAPFRKFLEQYRGLSISTPMVVGNPYGKSESTLTYLDGVTKATASVRIAHESLLAAARAVAQEKMKGVSAGPPAHPDPAHDEKLDWQALLDSGLASHLRVSNAEIDTKFAGTIWSHDDPEARADPKGTYLDLYLVDLGPPAIARAALAPDSLADLNRLLAISPNDEPILVIDAGRHGLVSPEFVRNTAPDRMTATQDGLPIALRDADLFTELAADAPEALKQGTAMILRTDRRLGFDPSRQWTLTVEAVRQHGIFQPEAGTQGLTLEHVTPARFFLRPETPRRVAPWQSALENRRADLIPLAAGLLVLLPLLLLAQSRLAGHRAFPAIRLGVLALVLGFVGWWGQGQLSIVTPLATLNTALTGGSLAFLLYDPFSLLVWTAAIAGFVLWGRGLFCGWLCPFGALQEFADKLGRLLRLPQIEPSAVWDRRLKRIKYLVLAALVGVAIWSPAHIDKVAEVEPFKTAITVYFVRDWYYVAYAVFWLVLAMVTFKGFCRYVCPLGALMAVGGVLRGRNWIPRRVECGSPCQLCRVKCRYGAIEKSGRIAYSECFQCLDCVTIHDDPRQCVPLVLAAKKAARGETDRPALDGVPAE